MNSITTRTTKLIATAFFAILAAFAAIADGTVVAIDYLKGTPYCSLNEAVESVTGGLTVYMVDNAVLSGELVLDGSSWLDLNGHYIDPDSSTMPRVVLNADSLCNDNIYSYSCINADITANVSVNFAVKRIYAFSVTLGKPGVEIVTAYPIAYCNSPSELYAVDESQRDDGCYVYTLVDNPEFVQVPTVALPTFAQAMAPTVQAKVTEWVDENYIDTELATEEAFLFNCDESGVEAARAEFRITSITIVDGNPVIKVAGDKTDGDMYGNGYIHVVPVALSGASAGGAYFYKAELSASLYD